MASIDLKKKIIPVSNPRHSRYQQFRLFLKRRADKRFRRRFAWSSVYFLAFVALTGLAFWNSDAAENSWYYGIQSDVEQVRVASSSRFVQLPIEELDPKYQTIVQYLEEKKSPLADYAGLLARMPEWKLLLGIAQAESNLCKKTNRNNCWGIGPGGPFTYEDIANSLYHANYLIERYKQLGMKKPETMVRTYVGWQNNNWVAAVNNVVADLQQRGLQ